MRPRTHTITNSTHTPTGAPRTTGGAGAAVRVLAVALPVLLLACAGGAGLAHAEPTVVVVALAQTVDEVLNNLRNWIMGVLAGLATVCWTVAGVRYVLAAGNPSEIEHAKAAVRAGAWGFVLAALAPLVVAVLKGIVGA